MIDLSQLLGVLVVFGSLLGTLIFLKRKGFAVWQGRSPVSSSGGAKRLQVRERVSLTATHSLHLVDADGRSFLIAVGPNSSQCISELTKQPTEVRS